MVWRPLTTRCTPVTRTLLSANCWSRGLVGSAAFSEIGMYRMPSDPRMASCTPALAHASAHVLWPAPDWPCAKHVTSTTWPVIVLSWPCAACAESGSECEYPLEHRPNLHLE